MSTMAWQLLDSSWDGKTLKCSELDYILVTNLMH